jgi:thiamine biosynthesis lipoprotein
MGSPLRLTIGDPREPSRAAAAEQSAWAEVVDEFEQSEQAMSRFRDASELIELNRAAGTGREVPVGRRLARAIAVADRARRQSGGRFEPRVIGDLDRLGYRGAPMASTTAGPTGMFGERAVAWDGGSRIADRGGRGLFRIDWPIDLGGIGKGLALRWAAGRLDRREIRSYLLEAGGDLVARGQPPDGGGWRIGIEDPTDAHSSLAVISATDTAMTTSSVGVNSWVVDGRPVHHLLDPTTGQPGGRGLLAVTVATTDPAWSEVWSKTLFLAGRDGIAVLAQSQGLAAWWVTVSGDLEMTPAGRRRTIWVAAEA